MHTIIPMYLVQLARMIMKDAEKHLVLYSKLCLSTVLLLMNIVVYVNNCDCPLDIHMWTRAGGWLCDLRSLRYNLCLQEEKDLSSEEEVKHKESVLILHALFLINHTIHPDENVCEIADSLLGQLRNKFRQVFILWLSGWCIQNNTNRHEEC